MAITDHSLTPLPLWRRRFQWPRDTGLCLRSLIGSLKQAEEGRDLGYTASEIERRIRDFITMSIQLQHTPNPSGTFETGGLGEPKFEVDGSAFTGSWGRPQNDGPALRSISAVEYARHILTSRDADDEAVGFVKNKLFAANAPASAHLLIRDDLNYLVRAWKSQTFELWEEVNADAGAGGGHFHVLMTQRRALLQGAQLARLASVRDEALATKWETAAAEITERLEKFWNPQGRLGLEGGPREDNDVQWDDARRLNTISQETLHAPHCVPTLARVSGQPKPVGADTAVLLGFTHGWDGDAGVKKDDTWEPWSERCLSTLNRNIEIFATVYDVNKGRKPSEGVVCGRYPEDVYDGVQTTIGNPWFLTTFAVSNVLYLTVAHYAKTSQPLVVDPSTTLPLFTKAYPSLAQTSSARVTYKRGTKEWEGILRGLRKMADDFLANASRFAADDGKMAEQIDRYSGQMRGARELSWSFASLLAAHQARSLLA